MSEALYVGLPRDLSPPRRVAALIAELPTLNERLALFARVPPGWQGLVAHQARIDIALAICEIPERDDRLVALAQVPPVWLDEVRWHVTRLWNTRELRAKYRTKRAAAHVPTDTQ